MNVLDEKTLKLLLRASTNQESTASRVVFRDTQFCAISNPSSVTVWFAVSRTSRLDAFSPRHEVHPTTMRGQDLIFKGNRSTRLRTIPIAIPGREVVSHNNEELFGSVVLYPNGLHGDAVIKAFDSVRGERIAFSVLRSDGYLVVFADSGPSERSPLCEKIFHVVLYAQVSLIASPSSVSFISSGRGESIFITDASSDMVCEFRFESSVLQVPRTCPDVSILFWYLESGLPVSDTCRVSFKLEEGSDPVATIIGLNNNSDSHGTVKLVTGRSPRFKGTISTRVIHPSIRVAGECVLANSRRHFRIFGPYDFDFPLGSRTSVTDFRILNISGQTVVVVQIDETVCFFAMEEGEKLRPLPWEDIKDVVSFQLSSFHHGGPKFHILVERSTGTVDLFTVDSRPGTVRQEASSTVPGDTLICMAVAEPVYESDPVATAIVGAGGCDGSLRMNPDCVACAISSWFVFQLLPGNVVHVDSRFSKISWTVLLPFPAQRLDIVQGVCHAVVAGTSILVASRDPYRGFEWEVVPSGISEGRIAVSADDCVFALTVDTGQIARHPPPGRLSESLATTVALPSTHPCSVYVECLDALHTGQVPDTLLSLPDALRKSIEELISAGSEVSRALDPSARRFLITWVFAGAYPESVALTTEDIAWAGMSETQEAIITRIVGQGAVTWKSLKMSGLLLWCSEPARIKDLTEGIQKSALQDYMKTKDAQILDDKIALWLAVLGKQQLLSSLYKQHGSSCASSSHTRIAQFLSLNFSDPENSSKATKNAFELVRQKRYGMAVAVFVLAGAWQEAVDICCRQMEDTQLALAILRVMETRIGLDQGLRGDLLTQFWGARIVGPAIEAGDRFLPLLFGYLRKDGSEISRIISSSSHSVRHLDGSLQGLKVRHTRLSTEAFAEYVTHLLFHLKRFNKPVPRDVAIIFPTPQDKAVRYLELGCPHLAVRMEGYRDLDPCLRWAIDSSLASHYYCISVEHTVFSSSKKYSKYTLYSFSIIF